MRVEGAPHNCLPQRRSLRHSVDIGNKCTGPWLTTDLLSGRREAVLSIARIHVHKVSLSVNHAVSMVSQIIKSALLTIYRVHARTVTLVLCTPQIFASESCC